jgi:hypothetical protein
VISFAPTSSRKIGAAIVEHNPTSRSYVHCASAKEDSRLAAVEHLLVITEDILQRLIDAEGITSSGWLPATAQAQHAATYSVASVNGGSVNGSVQDSRRSSVAPQEYVVHGSTLLLLVLTRLAELVRWASSTITIHHTHSTTSRNLSSYAATAKPHSTSSRLHRSHICNPFSGRRAMSLSSHSQFLWDKPQAVDLRVEEWCGDWGVRIEDFGKTPGTRVRNGAYSQSDDAAQLRCQNALDTAVLVRVQVDSRCTASVKSRGANHLMPYVNANVHARPPSSHQVVFVPYP